MCIGQIQIPLPALSNAPKGLGRDVEDQLGPTFDLPHFGETGCSAVIAAFDNASEVRKEVGGGRVTTIHPPCGTILKHLLLFIFLSPPPPSPEHHPDTKAPVSIVNIPSFTRHFYHHHSFSSRADDSHNTFTGSLPSLSFDLIKIGVLRYVLS